MIPTLALSSRRFSSWPVFGQTSLPSIAGKLLALPLVMMLAGCGMVAAPQPPSLKLPQPVNDLSAQRVGNAVDLHWTMPKRATDKVLLEGGQKAIILRELGASPPIRVGSLVLAPEAKASFTDVLPPALAGGPAHPLAYVVALDNHAGKTAGPSNQAWSAAGAAPAPLTGLQARAQADGILLSWNPTGENLTIVIRRRLQGTSIPANGKNSRHERLPVEQTLESTGPDQGRALDEDAALDHVYRYTVQRVQYVTLHYPSADNGRRVEIAGVPSEPVTINAKDIFPPAVPRGLQALADAQAHSIDLSWQPDSEGDLAGYIVYRSDKGSKALRKLATLVEPSYRDTSAMPGYTYEYSVSAVDKDGNESARSPEVEEALPNQ